MKTILASTWHVLDQQPPPSLREILDAYKSKGDGDRDMLMAMLNAKSAEDQRLASIASLHRTMLDMYQTPLPPPSTFPSHVSEGHRSHHTTCSHARHFPSPPTSYSYSPHAQMQSQDDRPSQLRHRTDSSASAASQNRERNFTSTSSTHLSRKRRRTSRSPPSRDHRTRAPLVPSQGTPSASAHDLPLPPSPYSSASSAQSSGGSPRSREAMMIGSLLSSNPHAQGSKDEDVPKRKISSERSTTTTSSRER
ncbi:hypothetical protein A0H81_00492 [Grifola frondosa]|uniref:Uncharacterized protein n=1 Tax=Grifola frondosa TaxID=5627 RepID=A0A1C7MRK3_GRIFR|nr:hypothetical protein A0H81_00492 [Grifola frondosa]